jgi:hypothetical protein
MSSSPYISRTSHILLRLLWSDNVPPLRIPWQRQRQHFKNRNVTSPSQQAQTADFQELQKDKATFYDCGRPADKEGRIPLTLLHPIFGQFVDEAKNIAPTRQDYATADQLRRDMCAFYSTEGKRRKQLCKILEEYGILIHPGNIGASQDSTDGHFCKRNHPMLIVELKNEIGWKGAEPFLQALLYYCVFCDQYNLWDDGSTCHPCLIIFLAG